MPADPDPAVSHPAARRRGARWEQLSRGVQIPSGLEGRPRLIAELAAYSQLLPASGVWAGLTVLRVHELWLPPLPASVPHFIAMGNVRGEVKPERERLRVTRHPTSPPRVEVDGVALQALPEAFRSAANVLGLVDLVVALDCAMHLELCSEAQLRVAASERRRGCRRLREALVLCDRRSESPWESMLRLLHVVCGIDVDPQVELFDSVGRFVARADLLVRGTRLLQEYDGAQHRDAAEHRRDLRRERGLADIGAWRRGYTAVDVMDHSPQILRAAADALGIAPPPSAAPWVTLLGDSLRTGPGRRAFLKRAGLATWE